MTDSKISFSLGNLSFSGEGDEAWLSGELDKILAAAQQFGVKATPKSSVSNDDSEGESEDVGELNESLATYLRNKNAEGNQNRG